MAEKNELLKHVGQAYQDFLQVGLSCIAALHSQNGAYIRLNENAQYMENHIDLSPF